MTERLDCHEMVKNCFFFIMIIIFITLHFSLVVNLDLRKAHKTLFGWGFNCLLKFNGNLLRAQT